MNAANNWGAWSGMLVFFVWILFWWTVPMFMRRMGWWARRPSLGKTALDILKERYAKGEINIL
jgi:uncharacterized membrane protein